MSKDSVKSSFKGFSHFRTITKHRHLVMKYCFMAGIPLQGLKHDLSKYGPTEFIPGARFYQGSRSPNEKEREAYGYSSAWLHHKGRNRHHLEYWTDYSPVTKNLVGVKMPLKYVIEMFCDRVAASRIYKGKDYNDECPLLYFEGRKTHVLIHPETLNLLEKLLKMLAKDGEKSTFQYIKNELRKQKDY